MTSTNTELFPSNPNHTATLFGRAILDGNVSRSRTYRSLSESDRDNRRTAFMMKFLCNDIKEFARSELTVPN